MEKNKEIKLTEYSSGAGWASKLSASELTQVLGNLSNIKNDSRLSGFDSFDDCGIYKIDEKQSIIQTLDFFTPIVDDPYLFGQIAASNSLSDKTSPLIASINSLIVVFSSSSIFPSASIIIVIILFIARWT